MTITTFTYPFSSAIRPYFDGTATSSLVPYVFPVAIDGRPYMVDQKSGRFQRNFEQRIRDSQDISTAPGESSINPGGLWRRGQDSWHMGAGQQYADAAGSQDYRFYKSKGIDPWTKGQLSLLNATKRSFESAATSGHMVVQDGRLYVALNGDVKYTTNPYASTPTWVSVVDEAGGTAAPTGTVQAMATDGNKIYLAYPNDGIRQVITTTDPAIISNTRFSTSSSDSYYMLGFAKNFMFGAYNHILHQIDTSGGKSDIVTPIDTTFTWVGVATGQNAVYGAGYSGKKSLVYKVTITSAGVLDKGVVALELPTGEVVSSISGYLGYILIGTNKGVRFCSTDDQANLVAGPIIPTSGPVKKFASEDKYTYFTWSNYDSVSGGLGRLDLSVSTGTNAPAFATDLMYNSTNDVLSVVVFDSKKCFLVSGVGVIAEDSSKYVDSGTFETGIWRWGIPDRKFVAKVDTRATPLVGSIKQYLQIDDRDWMLLGTWDTLAEIENSIDGTDSKAIEAAFKFELLSTETTNLQSPTMTRWMARAYVAPFRSQQFVVPILLHNKVTVRNKEYYYDVEEHQSFFDSLIESPRIVTLQIGNFIHTVIVDDVEWGPADAHGNTWSWEGTLVVTLRSVEN